VARKRTPEPAAHVNHERWLITYADMITLLMVLFIVLYSMSQADASKFRILSASLSKAFNVDVLRGDTPTSLHGEGGHSPATTVIQEAIVQAVPVVPDSRMIGAVEDLRATLLRAPQPASPAGGVEIGVTRDGVVVSLSGNVLFDSGKADLKPQGLILLDALAARLRTMPNEIRIEGHTDNIAITTPLYPSNWELSAARATTVGRYLTEHGGIAPTRVIAAGFGEHRPAASNDTREGRARNRRVDFVVLYPQVPVQSPDPRAPVGARSPNAGGQP
jgi:chemotaxis protein MotB